jgi:hypothetical protein
MKFNVRWYLLKKKNNNNNKNLKLAWAKVTQPRTSKSKIHLVRFFATCQKYWHSQSFENTYISIKITHMIEAAFVSIPIQTVSFNFNLIFVSFLPQIFTFAFTLTLNLTFFFIPSLYRLNFSLFSFCNVTKWIKKFPNRMWKLGKYTRISTQKKMLWWEFISMRC